MTLRRRTLFLGMLSLLAGCGGSGHSGSGVDSTARIGPLVTIAWPAASRGFSAPTFASTAVVTFPGAGSGGGDLSASVTRPSGTAAVTKTYLVGVAIQPGLRLMRVDFVSGPGGPALATASVNVKVLNDGTLKKVTGKPLGTIGFTSNIVAIGLDAGQSLEAGTTADLIVSASTSTGITGLMPGAATFQITSGSEFLRVNADGSFTGLAEGTATVVPSVAGLSGSPVTVTVLGAPIAARSVSLSANAIVADPTHPRVWVALPSSTSNGNSVLSIDDASGTLGTPIPVGSEPTVIAISDDGTTLYAGLKGALAIRKVDLTSNTATDQYPLPQSSFGNGQLAIDLKVQPGNASTIAVIAQDPTYNQIDGPIILDGGVARPNALGPYQGSQLVWTATDRIVASNLNGGPTGFFDIAVDDQGATLTRTTGSSSNGGGLLFSGSRLYDRSGAIYDASSLSRLGLFDLTALGSQTFTQFDGPAIDETARRAYFVEESSQVLYLRVYDLDTFALRTRRRLLNVVSNDEAFNDFSAQLVRTGTSSLAIKLNGQIVILNDVSGL